MWLNTPILDEETRPRDVDVLMVLAGSATFLLRNQTTTIVNSAVCVCPSRSSPFCSIACMATFRTSLLNDKIWTKYSSFWSHRRNNRRNRGRLLGRSFQKARIFTASTYQNAGFSIWVFINFPGVIPLDPHSGRGDPLPPSTPSPAFDRARGASAPVLGPKPWSPSTF